MMTGTEVKNSDVSYLNNLLLDKMGLLRVLPAKTLQDITHPHLQLWANKNGVYVFPTTELIQWLKEKIGKRTAIEIGAGHGAIGRALDVPRTDSYIQLTPEMQLLYRMNSQKPTTPPPDVLRYEASDAVARFKPQVVFGGYITQLYQPGDEQEPKTGSSIHGVNELEIHQKVETYIVIGNMMSHHDKRLFLKTHEILTFDWIVTRSLNHEKNRIFIWERNSN
jgi:hypothetical protein